MRWRQFDSGITNKTRDCATAGEYMENLLQKLMLSSSAAALLMALPTSQALAQDDIEQVVVSASRVTIAGYTQPTPVTVVGAAQLEQNRFPPIVFQVG